MRRIRELRSLSGNERFLGPYRPGLVAHWQGSDLRDFFATDGYDRPFFFDRETSTACKMSRSTGLAKCRLNLASWQRLRYSCSLIPVTAIKTTLLNSVRLRKAAASS